MNSLFSPVTAVFIITILIWYYTLAQWTTKPIGSIDGVSIELSTPSDGPIPQSWGQYSPYFDVPSNISPDLPDSCQYTFAQILSRHGSRFPTAFKSLSYRSLIDRLQANVHSFSGSYRFLEDYKYELGSDQLTVYGEQELISSGEAFYNRYHNLTKSRSPFIRASGQRRVIRSAEMFAEGYHSAHLADRSAPQKKPIPKTAVIISEEAGSNNTLSINTCPAFFQEPNINIGSDAQARWAALFVPAIQDRLNRDLLGAELASGDIIALMDLCPFETVSGHEPSLLSPFCRLFTEAEWQSYDYYQTLGKYYGHSMGNPLAPTQGVGFVNELVSRLTHSPVHDETSTNHTLDSSDLTFPLHEKLYADFSHDNDMAAIYAAMGLYNDTPSLPLTWVRDAENSSGFSAAWTVPFGARMYVEKMICVGDDEYVRVLVNNRVIPLISCGADHLGRCLLDKFVRSLSFARNGGLWDRCFNS